MPTGPDRFSQSYPCILGVALGAARPTKLFRPAAGILALAAALGVQAADAPRPSDDTSAVAAASGVSSSAAVRSADETPASEDDRKTGRTPAGSAKPDATDAKKKGVPVRAYYKDGLHVESADGNFAATFKWRVQMRISDLKSDFFGEEDGIEEESGFLIRRARFKLNGHAYRPWLKYYMEYGIAASILLTLQADVQPMEEVGLRAGQYKVLYNRERVDSSGKLQFIDRSIVNSPFTVDRQSGLTVLGRLFAETRADSNYAFGVFTGTGRGGPLESDGRPMYVGRWQWNFLKRVLAFSQSDTKVRAKPAASVALAASSNVSAFTRFSSGGGGQLAGFPDATEPGQYKLEQWMGELAYQHRGLSLQGEYHFKRIDDRLTDQTTELDGYYAQAGYFFHEVFEAFPRPLELAVRVARVDTIKGVTIPEERETTIGANWFFHGHNNKLSLDGTRLERRIATGENDTGTRVRLQWDVTF